MIIITAFSANSEYMERTLERSTFSKVFNTSRTRVVISSFDRPAAAENAAQGAKRLRAAQARRGTTTERDATLRLRAVNVRAARRNMTVFSERVCRTRSRLTRARLGRGYTRQLRRREWPIPGARPHVFNYRVPIGHNRKLARPLPTTYITNTLLDICATSKVERSGATNRQMVSMNATTASTIPYIGLALAMTVLAYYATRWNTAIHNVAICSGYQPSKRADIEVGPTEMNDMCRYSNQGARGRRTLPDVRLIGREVHSTTGTETGHC